MMNKNAAPFKRLVKKSGGLNFKIINVEDKGERYISDFFTTLGKLIKTIQKITEFTQGQPVATLLGLSKHSKHFHTLRVYKFEGFS
jgi:hypothetical protein